MSEFLIVFQFLWILMEILQHEFRALLDGFADVIKPSMQRNDVTISAHLYVST